MKTFLPRPWTAGPLLALAALVLASCADPAVDGADTLPPLDPDRFAETLAESGRPTVVNVWGSWCVPCRAEAPRLAEAHRRHGQEVDFVGVAVEDTQSDAVRFVEEYGIEYPQLFDPEGRIRGLLGGTGAPITFFVAPGGEVVRTHFGEIDAGELDEAIGDLLDS